ncbi:MAG: hypothetical protein R2828_32195 [Saprospiraceae bacterium]
MIKQIAIFLLLVIGTAFTTYYTSPIIASLYYVGMLVAYFKSKNEPLWLAVFFVISDDFIGFFGPYQTTLAMLPGLPPIEIGQLYIILTIVKAYMKGPVNRPFYHSFLWAMLIYTLFLVVQGYVLGLTMALNVAFRIVKEIIPLFLLYSIPRLMDKEKHYQEFFSYLYPIAFSALLAQIFTISMSVTPSEFLGGTEHAYLAFDVSKGKTYRGFFSSAIVLLTFLGAFYFLTKKDSKVNQLYLYAVIAANCLTAFLSATRGYVISFTFMLFLFIVFINRLNIKRVAMVGIIGTILFFGMLSVPVVGLQVTNAVNRLLTVKSIAEGDVTAGGTLVRLSERSPKVIKWWLESPLTGWGFSDVFMRHGDLHVANQNILMHAGIAGFLLMFMFFFYFNWKLFLLSASLPRSHPAKDALLTFIVYFLGWFLIHSSSGQHFSYYQLPQGGLLIGVFFSFGALAYKEVLAHKT